MHLFLIFVLGEKCEFIDIGKLYLEFRQKNVDNSGLIDYNNASDLLKNFNMDDINENDIKLITANIISEYDNDEKGKNKEYEELKNNNVVDLGMMVKILSLLDDNENIFSDLRKKEEDEKMPAPAPVLNNGIIYYSSFHCYFHYG